MRIEKRMILLFFTGGHRNNVAAVTEIPMDQSIGALIPQQYKTQHHWVQNAHWKSIMSVSSVMWDNITQR